MTVPATAAAPAPMAAKARGFRPTFSFWMVLAMCFFVFGGFGIHSFYLGFTTKGIIQILVTLVTCGLGSIWGLIEGILYLVNGGKDANGVDLV